MKRSRSSRRSKQRRINKANRAAAEKARQEENVVEVEQESSVKITEISNESSDSEIQSESKGIVCEVENDTNTRVSETPSERKAKKKEALMQYFMPVYHNPRFLDVISEESSDASDRDSKISCHQESGFTEIPTHSESIVGDTNVELVFLQDVSSNETDSDEDSNKEDVEQNETHSERVDGDTNVELIFLQDASSNETYSDEESNKEDENDVEQDSLEENKVQQNDFVAGNKSVVDVKEDVLKEGNRNKLQEHNAVNVIAERYQNVSLGYNVAQKNVSSEHNGDLNVRRDVPLEHNADYEQISLEDKVEYNVHQNVCSEHDVDRTIHQDVLFEHNSFQESKKDNSSEINESCKVDKNVFLEHNIHKKVSFEHTIDYNVNKNVISEHNVKQSKKDNDLKANKDTPQECNVNQNVSSEHNVHQNVSCEHNVLFETNVQSNDEGAYKKSISDNTTKTSALSPPRSPSLSSNGSSSRGTSLCTARYNPSIGDIASLAKDEELAQASLNFKQPSRLRELCLNFLLSQPFGADVLKELANVSKVIDEFTSTLPSKVISTLLKDNVKQRQLMQLANKIFNIPAAIEMSETNTATKPKDSREDDLYLYYEENEKSRLQAKELSEWLELARNKSVSETNLTKTGVNQTKKQPHANYSRRASLPNNFYQQQLLLIQEKEREIQRQLEELEEEKRKLLSAQFTPDDYIISSKGDIAIYNEKKKPFNTTTTPTEAEVFRQQMYDEYMQQLAERDDRRLHKVIKLSAPHPNENSPKDSKFDTIHPTDIEDEFMEQVKKRKLGGGVNKDAGDSDEISSGIFDSDSEPIIILDGSSVSCTTTSLPRHIQEFAEGEWCV